MKRDHIVKKKVRKEGRKMMMMMIRDENLTDPSWKLYENPFYYSKPHHQKEIVSSSLWDVVKIFNPVVMEKSGDIDELRAELEYERKARKKTESLNKRLARDISEERRAREALEKVCQEFAKEIAENKSEIDRMRKEIDDERKMLKMAEVLREERVQMKLADAKILLEEKIQEYEYSTTPKIFSAETAIRRLPEHFTRLVLAEKACDDNISTVGSSSLTRRKLSPEAENPHIKRGIKGFVEFPRVVKAIGLKSSSNRHWCSKLECQKAQLRILLKQKCPIRSDNTLIIG